MYKTRSNYLKYLSKYGRSKGANIRNKVGLTVDVYKEGSDYYIKIQDRIVNLVHFSSRDQLIKFARRKIREAFKDENIRSRYIKRVDGKLHNMVPDSVFSD